MSVPLWAWVALVAAIGAMAALDLVAVGRGGRRVAVREATAWSVAWIAVGLGFALVLPFEGDYDGCCARRQGWLLPPLEHCAAALSTRQ